MEVETMQLRGKKCFIDSKGRITVEEPFFTATISQLKALLLISQGRGGKAVADELNKTHGSIATLMNNLRRDNNYSTTTKLIGTATKLDLLNSIAIDGIRTKKAELIK